MAIIVQKVVAFLVSVALPLAASGLVPLLGPPPSMPTFEAAQVSFGPSGISAIKYGGFDFLQNGNFQINSAVLKDQNGATNYVSTTHSTSHEPATQTTRQAYPWGTVSCAFATASAHVTMHVKVVNNSRSTMSRMELALPTLKFPQKPAQYDGNTPMLGHNVGAPTTVPLNYGSGVCVLANDDVTRPLLAGLPWAYDRPTSTVFPILVNTGRKDEYPASLPFINAPIPPGGTLEFTLSLRFGPAGSTVESLAGDLLEDFAATFPYTNQWTDRRSIGALFLASSSRNFAKNPRGWFGDASIDTTTPAGLTEFRKHLLWYADQSITILRSMNSQGMITWDCEGQEFPHAVSYLGDPRTVEERAPEMAPVIDEYFRRFREAGLRVGVCIRPQQLVVAPDGLSADQQHVADPTQLLIDKIAYAKDRWGATLFYLDSNGDQNDPTDAAMIERVLVAHPDILLIPEAKNIRYYRATAPYQELQRGATAAPANARSVYPGAFSAIYTPNTDIGPWFDALVQGVRQGNILMYHGWYNAGANATVKRIYDTAAQP